MKSRRIRVAGIGNTLAGDDAIGIRAVDMIRKADWKHVETLALSTPGPELFDGLKNEDLLILIDACQSGAAAGSVLCFNMGDISVSGLRHCSTHGISLCDWLALTQASGGRVPQIRVYGVEMQQCAMGEPLSEVVAASVPDLLQQVQSCIETCRLIEISHA